MRNNIKSVAIWSLLIVASIVIFSVSAVFAHDEGAAAVAAIPAPLFLGTMLYGRKMFDWTKVKELGSMDEVRKAIVERGAELMKEIADMPVPREGVKLSGPDATLIGAGNPVVLVQSDTVKTPDRGYEILFDEVDMRASSNDAFDVLDVSGGVVFYQIKPGEEVKLSKIGKGALTSVKYLRFAGGLNILDDWIRFNKFYLIDKLFADTTRNWWSNRATLFYSLLAALGAGINQAFDTSDIKTINNACANILVDCEAAGLPVDENAQFVITCNPLLKARIMEALAMTFQTQGVNKKIVYNISSVVTSSKVAATSYYVSLPGLNNQRGEWEDLTSRPAQRDEQHLGSVNIWTGAYNGIIGQSKQHKRCALA